MQGNMDPDSRRAFMRVACLPVQACEEGRWLHEVRATRDGEPLARVRFWTAETAGHRPRATGRTAALTFLPLAMRLGLDVEVDDGLDAVTQAHLGHWAEVMAAWHGGPCIRWLCVPPGCSAGLRARCRPHRGP